MNDGEMNVLVSALAAARSRAQPADITRAQLPETLETAYRTALAQVPAVAAWKIGAANDWSRNAFGIEGIFCGPLHPHEMVLDTETLSLDGLIAPLAEPEIMLEIADWTSSDPQTRFGRMGIGIEFPATVLPQELKPELMGQIVDRAGAGALWIAGLRPFNAALFEDEITLRMVLNEAPPTASSSRNVINGPLGAAQEFLDLARRHTMPLAAGQWISTGGLSPAISIQRGDTLTLTSVFGAVTLRLE